MASAWYYEIDGERRGPVSSAQLRQLAVAGKLRPQHLIWKEGLKNKIRADLLKGLFDGLPTAGAPVPAKQPTAAAPPALRQKPSAPPLKKTADSEELVEAVALEPIEELE